MVNRTILISALLLVFTHAAPPLLSSQDLLGAGSAQSQQNGSMDCSDPMAAAGAGCLQQQTGQSPSFQAPSYQEGTVPTPSNLGTALPENAVFGEQGRGSKTLQQPLLPPDQPTEFQKFVAETTGQLLPIYGEELFRRVPSTFAPSNQVAIPPQYVVGPGDELRIRVWGQINFSGNLRVDRSGNIYLPQIGAIQVSGLQFSMLDQHLRSAVAKLYRNFDLSVEVGDIRSIQVYIAGQARRPGAYTVSALSSLVDALFAGGGPSPAGSLRHILLKRDGQTIIDFDLYALLIHGDKSKDARLLPEDVLYIPPAGNEVAITGSVRTPGIYELRSGETVSNLIEMAGETTAVASNSRIVLERVDQHQARTADEIEFNAVGLATVLKEGDILRVDSILPAFNRTITMRGNVANPGRFGWHPGMHLSDLIPDVDSLVSRDYWWKRGHLGLPAPEFEPVVSALGQTRQSLQNGAAGRSTNPAEAPLIDALRPKDQSSSSDNLSEPSEAAGKTSTEQGTNSAAERGANASLASGANRSTTPGAEHGYYKNTVRLADNQIDWNYAVIERVDPKSLKTVLIPFDLGKLVLDHDPSVNLPLEPGDTVTIFSQSDIIVPVEQQTIYVELEGEFLHPGYYSVLPGDTLRDVVNKAGGFTPGAYLYGSEFRRESTRVLQQQRLDDYVRSLTVDAERGTQALALTSTSASSMADVTASRTVTEDMIARLSQVKATGRIVLQFLPDSSNIADLPSLRLENGDKFVVPYLPANINVVGAVNDQNSYLYEKGRTLGYYLQMAGGTNRNADWRHAFLIRADGSVVSRLHTSGTGFWKESFLNLKLYPGDTIVVPDKTLRPTALRNFMDWSQIFSQMALGAAAINVL